MDGIIGACLTPFDGSGRVDGSLLERELDFLVGHCDAISILGVEASEYRCLSESERREWLRFAIKAVAVRVPVIAGASSPRYTEVLELAELAEDAGAEFIQVLIPRSPWGPEASAAEIIRFFELITERSPLPIVLYHNPPYGSDPSIATIVTLCDMDQIVAFKDSSRDSSRIGQLCRKVGAAGRADYFTTMQPLLATLAEGGAGAAMPPPATVIGARVVRAYRAGDFTGAAAMQSVFSDFPGRWSAYGLPPVMKCALGQIGIDVGICASPYGIVTPEDVAAIGQAIAKLHLDTL